MPARYTNAPLIEVNAEFQFKPATDWDLTLPGAMSERLKQQFPKKRQINVIAGVQIAGGPGGFGQQFIPQSRVQFFRPDESAIIQVGPNLLAVNHLRPYQDWDSSFRPVLQAAWDAYKAVGGNTTVQGLKLKYINRLELPMSDKQCRYEDYLEFRPHIGLPLSEAHGPFMLGVSFMYREHDDWLTVTLQSEATSESKGSLILDLDYSMLNNPPAESDILDWFDNAHGHIDDKFEECINDDLRKLLGRIENATD